MSFKDIAQEMGLTELEVHRLYNSAIRKIRDIINNNEEKMSNLRDVQSSMGGGVVEYTTSLDIDQLISEVDNREAIWLQDEPDFTSIQKTEMWMKENGIK